MELSTTGIDTDKIAQICDLLDSCTDEEMAKLFDWYFVRFARVIAKAAVKESEPNKEIVGKIMESFDELSECCGVDEI